MSRAGASPKNARGHKMPAGHSMNEEPNSDRMLPALELPPWERRETRSFQAHEIILAIGFSLLAQAGIFIALRSSPSHLPAPEEPAHKAPPIAIKVNAAFELGEDAPILKFGGTPDKSRLPDREAPPIQKARAEEKTFVSTEAGKEAKDIPAEEKALAKPEEKPPPPEAEITKQVDTPVAPTAEAPKTPANINEKGSQDGLKEGTETDPLKARAVDLYRARIISWFSRRFRVSGSGLSAGELKKYRVSATVELSEARGIVGYSIVPSGNSAFDAAARSALEAAKGQSLPPPPEDYPDVVQSRIHLTFVCKEDRCD